MIDLPQVVDVISHPSGRSFLDYDAKNVATWFARAGHPDADPEALARLLAEEAHLALADDRENREDREPAATRVDRDQGLAQNHVCRRGFGRVPDGPAELRCLHRSADEVVETGEAAFGPGCENPLQGPAERRIGVGEL
jgi:hypothetical protein